MLLLTNLAEDGRALYNDDLEVLQSQLLAAATATLPALGSVILSGCVVTPGVTANTYNVSPGLVWLGTLRKFNGAEGVALPGFIGIGAAVTSGPRLFETGATKDAYVEYQASWDTIVTAGAIAFSIDNPGLTYWQAVAAQGREIGKVEYVTDTTGYDDTGKGYGSKRGWQLANGSLDTADLRGQFVVGKHPDVADYDSVGNTGGLAAVSLTAEQNGEHSHPMPDYSGTITYASGDSGGHSPNSGNKTTVQSGKSGLGAEHENRPPYYVLAVRQWIGL